MLVESLLPAARRRLMTITDDAPLLEAARLLGTGIDLIVVCDRSSHVAGIVTKTDVVVKVGRSPDVAYVAPLSAVMTRDVVFCRPQDSTDDVWSKMRSLELKNIPVVDGEFSPLGLLVARDVLQALLREAGHDGTLLRDYVMCVGYH